MREVVSEIDISAPPTRVWTVLTDFARFPEWNPFIREIAGEPRLGAKLRVKMASGSRTFTFRPSLLEVVPPQRLRWLGHLLVPRLFDGEHRFHLEPRGDGTHFTQAEKFTGLLVPLTGRLLAATHKSFERMNAALKDRAESSTQ